jgi:hypothetical protein
MILLCIQPNFPCSTLLTRWVTERAADCVTSQAVWDIIAIIRNKNAEKKAEARRYSVIKQHCQMYDKTNSG